jgi:hypothetical protein
MAAPRRHLEQHTKYRKDKEFGQYVEIGNRDLGTWGWRRNNV